MYVIVEITQYIFVRIFLTEWKKRFLNSERQTFDL